VIWTLLHSKAFYFLSVRAFLQRSIIISNEVSNDNALSPSSLRDICGRLICKLLLWTVQQSMRRPSRRKAPFSDGTLADLQVSHDFTGSGGLSSPSQRWRCSLPLIRPYRRCTSTTPDTLATLVPICSSYSTHQRTLFHGPQPVFPRTSESCFLSAALTRHTNGPRQGM
jgi:hypothetical protein